MVAFYVQGNTGQGASKAGVTTFKGLGHDPYGGRLVDPEDDEQVLSSILLSQIFYLFLYRKTYGAGSSSDKTGGGLINDFNTSSLETVADRCSGNVIPFAKDYSFFSF